MNSVRCIEISRRRSAVVARAVLASMTALLVVGGCVHDVDEGADFIEPEDTRDNVDQQGLYDCTERPDTGYRQGDDFSISVVTVDARPVETATANAYIAMQSDAASDGVGLRIVSGFRTMAQQQHLYGCYTNCNCNSCNLAARPGYSNHQSGHALDLNSSDPGVASWLTNNAGRFGFSRTVPSEPWHWEWWGDASDFNGPCGGGGGGAADDDACAPLPASGGVVDDGDGCFDAGGPSQYLRAVDGQGHAGDLLWTGTTDRASAVNFAAWNLALDVAGRYTVEAFVEGSVATSRQAKYAITHSGTTDSVVVDQRGGARWVSLGTFAFATGAAQRVRLTDNTGERGALGRKIVLDAVRLTPVAADDGADAECPYVEVVTTGSALNVRPDPSTARAAVGALADGDVVRRTETVSGQLVAGSTDWHAIETDDVSGFVAGAFTICRAQP